MGSVAVRFLDGPLAEQVRQVEAQPQSPAAIAAGAPPRPKVDRIAAAVPQFSQWDDDGTLMRADYVTYRVKRSHYRDGPPWVAAIGEKVGELVTCVQPFQTAARASMGAAQFREATERVARDALQRACAAEGLVAADVREAFTGTADEARMRWMTGDARYDRGPYEALRAAETLPNLGEGMGWSVWFAVAAVGIDESQAVTAWA